MARGFFHYSGVILFACTMLFSMAWAQAPYGPPSMPPTSPGPLGPQHTMPQPQPPMQPGPPAAPQQEQPMEYAFRPDLTNPQYGQCLQLEKHWQAQWRQYYDFYHRHRMMSPSDPQYAQMTHYVQMLKQQLDHAWATFSSQCIHFPSRRR